MTPVHVRLEHFDRNIGRYGFSGAAVRLIPTEVLTQQQQSGCNAQHVKEKDGKRLAEKIRMLTFSP
jgi:hypothetical protein